LCSIDTLAPNTMIVQDRIYSPVMGSFQRSYKPANANNG
jgi:hypothetical protein